MDQEDLERDDEAVFDPDRDVRDYLQVSAQLPVFCVSSRTFQKLRGHLPKDRKAMGFRNFGETEIPQLQGHVKQLTEAGRIHHAQKFLNELMQFLNSLMLWAVNDSSGLNLCDEQKQREVAYLMKAISGLQKVVLARLHEVLDGGANGLTGCD